MSCAGTMTNDIKTNGSANIFVFVFLLIVVVIVFLQGFNQVWMKGKVTQ